jgi:hypothetical protein
VLLAYTVLTSTVQVMAAGPLVRRQGPRLAVLLPYFEQALPATILIVLTMGFAFLEILVRHIVNLRPALPWFLALSGLMALAYTGAQRGWPWPVRVVVHAAWLIGIAVFVVLLRTGVIVVHYR